MSDTVIQVHDLWKRYRLGVLGTGTLRHDLNRWWHRVRGKEDPYTKVGVARGTEAPTFGLSDDEMWALQGVSFEVKQGEILGIIGKNGAGKSTLLKILSRVTAPTSGEVRIKGRIASLLEVGTGFHPELTGRENIFLNGAILGMTKPEIRKKFDEIVSFSGVEQFIDTPVKRYSSGMYVRLAFAVAAHLEPEILIVDEVLAVGDIAFQQKCLGKMREVSTEGGRTVLFVSHNMGAIEALCSCGLHFEDGRLVFNGFVRDAVSRYLNSNETQALVSNFEGCIRNGTGEAEIMSIQFEDDRGNLQTHFRMGEPLNVIVKVHFPKPTKNPTFGVNFETNTGVRAADCRSSHYGLKAGLISGAIQCRMRIEALPLYPRTYIVEPWVSDATCSAADYDWVRNAATIVVTSGPNFLDGASVNSQHGVSHIPTQWSANLID
jgi:lipopolysaccharide transport system ATP-binding protein